MVKQKALFYYYRNAPGIGILASHETEGWQRVNLYGFGLDMDALLKDIEEDCEGYLMREGMLAARPAQSRVIIAGGVVFKGLTCLVGEGVGAGRILSVMEDKVSGFRVVDAARMTRVESITPLDVYCFVYGNKVVGIARVVFFEYATQMSLVGVYRDQDRNLLDELLGSLSKLNAYMTIPNPLRTDERDGRIEVNMFMIRHPIKEELQSDFVRAIMRIPALHFYTS